MSFFRMSLVAIVFVLALVQLSGANEITTFQVNPDNGFVVYKMQPEAVVEKYLKVLHVVDLKIFENCFQNVEENLKKLNLVDEHDIDLIVREIKLGRTGLSALVPHAFRTGRAKRGLINIGGTFMKMLWGTMDEDDAREIYDHLQTLDDNAKQLTDQVNKQVEINNDLIKNLNTVVNSVNKQQSRINAFMGNITARTNKALGYAEKFRVILQTYADLSILNRQIEKISDIVMMSKQNILSHDILTEEERTKYNITVETLPFLGTNILFFEEKIVFVLQIPKFATETYFRALVIPFPNKQHEELNSPIEEVLVQGRMVYKNKEKIIVKRNLLAHDNDCIRNAFQQNNDCRLKFNEEGIIQELSYNKAYRLF